MLDGWFTLLLFLNLASHYLLVGLGPSWGAEPVTKASEVNGSVRDSPPTPPAPDWAASLAIQGPGAVRFEQGQVQTSWMVG